MLLSATQRRFLAVTALVALGFVLGLAIQAPTVQQSVLGIDATRPVIMRSAALATRPLAADSEAVEPEAAGCPDHGSDCATRDTGRGSPSERSAGPAQAQGAAAELPQAETAAGVNPEQRLVTVYHGSKPTQYVVAREP